MSDEAKRAVGMLRVGRDEYARDPGRVVERARTGGPITITDALGKPRMTIVIPKHVRTAPDQ
jgi:hypothetical protein